MSKWIEKGFRATIFILSLATMGGCGQSTKPSGQFDKYEQVHELSSRGKDEEVVKICNLNLKASPTDAEFLAYRGTAEAHLGQKDAGLADLRQAISINDKRSWYYIQLAYILMHDSQPREGLDCLKKAAKWSSDESLNASIHSGMALAYGQLNLPEQAISEAGEALKTDPKQISAYQARSFAELDLFEKGKALDDANKMVELDPNDPGSYATRATVYLLSGDMKKALTDANKALALKPDYEQAIEVIGAAKIYAGSAEDSLKLVEQIIAKSPARAGGYADKAICCLALNDMKNAQVAADKAFELNPHEARFIEPALYVAAIDGDSSRTDELLSQLRKVVDGTNRYNRDYATVLVFQGKNQEAIKFCSAEIDKGHATPHLYRCRAEAYRRMKKFELADADMKNAVEHGYGKIDGLEILFKVSQKR
jgi:tetratricopeptide (TPR) repeat protein